LSLFALVIAPPAAEPLDSPLSNGWFYKEANGFDGAGQSGFAVTDDSDASMWSEFERLGGVDRLGYPISQRFLYGGLVTQAFQRAALQWQPDLAQAARVKILEDLGTRGNDAWLDQVRHIPPQPDPRSDAGLSLDELFAVHHQLLDAYPPLRDFFDADNDPLSTYGLPVSVKEYGHLVSVRLERATLAIYTSDAPGVATGNVVVGNTGDLARDVGLWPLTALVPGLAPAAPPTEVADPNLSN
jgi:hypothetical protein